MNAFSEFQLMAWNEYESVFSNPYS